MNELTESFRQEELEDAPVISQHDAPQETPQEWDCGCVTAAFVTDRDALAGETPFDMRLARPCGTQHCELAEEPHAA